MKISASMLFGLLVFSAVSVQAALVIPFSIVGDPQSTTVPGTIVGTINLPFVNRSWWFPRNGPELKQGKRSRLALPMSAPGYILEPEEWILSVMGLLFLAACVAAKKVGKSLAKGD